MKLQISNMVPRIIFDMLVSKYKVHIMQTFKETITQLGL